MIKQTVVGDSVKQTIERDVAPESAIIVYPKANILDSRMVDLAVDIIKAQKAISGSTRAVPYKGEWVELVRKARKIVDLAATAIGCYSAAGS